VYIYIFSNPTQEGKLHSKEYGPMPSLSSSCLTLRSSLLLTW